MSAKDAFHTVVKTALEKEGWLITHDPYTLQAGTLELYVDLGAEKVIAAEKEGQKIAVEIKSFLSPSKITELYAALGQFIIYRIALQEQEANRTLYLAVPSTVYNNFFILPFIQSVIKTNQLFLLIYNIEQEANAYSTLRERPMAKLDEYRQYIKNLLQQHASTVWDNRIQAQTIFDPEHDHYQLVYVGWRDQNRIYGPVLHLDIIDEKIWIQQDGTEVGIANELLELGVPKEDIVLGFQLPSVRKYTDFAVS